MSPLRFSVLSIIPLPGRKGHSGGGDAPSVKLNPTSSLSGRKARQGQWASSAIQKKVNSLLCSKLALLLGLATPGLKWMDSPISSNSNDNNGNGTNNTNNNNGNTTITTTKGNDNDGNISTSILLQVSADGGVQCLQNGTTSNTSGAKILEYLEVYDYIGGASFRGLVAEKKLSTGDHEKSLFLFFEEGVRATELKQGLVALIDLATECFDCQNLVVCLDRELDGLNSLVHDLGWVGFELYTLKHWSDESHKRAAEAEQDYTSEKWLFLGMEL